MESQRGRERPKGKKKKAKNGARLARGKKGALMLNGMHDKNLICSLQRDNFLHFPKIWALFNWLIDKKVIFVWL